MGDRATILLDAGAHAIANEPVTTARRTLQRYRHEIVAIVNGSANRPLSAQAKIKKYLKGTPGLSPDQQAANFTRVVELTDEARPGNHKAQSCRVVAAKGLQVIAARVAEAEARRRPVAPAPIPLAEVEDAWGDEDDSDDGFDVDWDRD